MLLTFKSMYNFLFFLRHQTTTTAPTQANVATTKQGQSSLQKCLEQYASQWI